MYEVYQIAFGDTLEKIANKFGITLDELKKLNNGISGFLRPGMLIVVPSSNNNFSKYIIEKGDNLYSIAKKFNVSVDTLYAINGLSKDEYIYPGEIILIPKENISVYMTKDGDTITDLNTLGQLNEILTLNSKIYLLPNQAVLYKKRG